MARSTRRKATTLADGLEILSGALDDIAEANRALVAQHKRLRALFARLKGLAQTDGSAAARRRAAVQMMQVQMAMQRENVLFTSISNVLKTRHETAKNSIGNVR